MKKTFQILIGNLILISLILSINSTNYLINTNQIKTAAAGDVWTSSGGTQLINSTFNIYIYVDTGSQKLATFGIEIEWNQSVIEVLNEEEGVQEGSTIFTLIKNVDNSTSYMNIAGVNIIGKGPSSNLQILTISWRAISIDESILDITVNNLSDENTNPIGMLNGIDGNVEVVLEKHKFSD